MAKKPLGATTIVPLKKAHCPTLSGKSQLEYALGRNDAGEFYLHLVAGTDGGFFAKAWVAWQ